MEYRKIVSVTGLPGLFEIISSKTDGAIVRSLDDKATKFVSSRTHNLSHLESIEVYTVNDNVNLSEIFFAIEKAGTKLPEEKDAKAVKKFFEKVYPDLDFERVYNSDMKKMVRWYGILKEHEIEVKLPEEQAEEPEVEEPVEEEKPVKKAKAKKTEDVEEVKETKSKKTEKAEEVKETKSKKSEPAEDKKPAKPAAKAKKAEAPAEKPAPKKSAKKK